MPLSTELLLRLFMCSAKTISHYNSNNDFTLIRWFIKQLLVPNLIIEFSHHLYSLSWYGTDGQLHVNHSNFIYYVIKTSITNKWYTTTCGQIIYRIHTQVFIMF